jgi:hypothetical protein
MSIETVVHLEVSHVFINSIHVLLNPLTSAVGDSRYLALHAAAKYRATPQTSVGLRGLVVVVVFFFCWFLVLCFCCFVLSAVAYSPSLRSQHRATS